MKKTIGFLIILVLILIIFVFAQDEKKQIKSEITVVELKEKIDNKEDMFLLDVRTEAEFNGSLGHIEGATLIPVGELKSRIDELEKYKDKEILVICRSGNRSRMATNILKEDGFNAINIAGGMLAYRALEQKESKQDSTARDTVKENENNQ